MGQKNSKTKSRKTASSKPHDDHTYTHQQCKKIIENDLGLTETILKKYKTGTEEWEYGRVDVHGYEIVDVIASLASNPWPDRKVLLRKTLDAIYDLEDQENDIDFPEICKQIVKVLSENDVSDEVVEIVLKSKLGKDLFSTFCYFTKCNLSKTVLRRVFVCVVGLKDREDFFTDSSFSGMTTRTAGVFKDVLGEHFSIVVAELIIKITEIMSGKETRQCKFLGVIGKHRGKETRQCKFLGVICDHPDVINEFSDDLYDRLIAVGNFALFSKLQVAGVLDDRKIPEKWRIDDFRAYLTARDFLDGCNKNARKINVSDARSIKKLGNSGKLALLNFLLQHKKYKSGSFYELVRKHLLELRVPLTLHLLAKIGNEKLMSDFIDDGDDVDVHEVDSRGMRAYQYLSSDVDYELYLKFEPNDSSDDGGDGKRVSHVSFDTSHTEFSHVETSHSDD